MHIFINLAEYFIEHIEHFCRYFQIKNTVFSSLRHLYLKTLQVSYASTSKPYKTMIERKKKSQLSKHNSATGIY